MRIAERPGSRIRTILLIAAATIASLVVIFVGALAVPASRDALVRIAAAAYLGSKGFHLANLDVTVGHGRLEAAGIRIEEAGRPFLTADKISVDYGARGRALGISAVDVEHPRLVVRREKDGSYDIARLVGTGGGGGGGGAPLNMSLRVRNGSVDVINAYAPARPGRLVSVQRINGEASIRQGAISAGRASLLLADAKAPSPVVARFAENDVARIAHATVRVRGAALAPLVDLIVSSNAFVVQDGVADLTVRAYAAGWSADTGPQWRAIGDGYLRHGTLRTLPFAVPIRDVAGPLSLFDGTLAFSQLTASAAGVPLTASGTVALLPDQRLGLRLRASGPLSRVRRWLPFSATLPLSGDVAVAAAVDGAPTDPHVDVELRGLRGLRYAAVPVKAFRSNAYYHDGHVALRDTFASYEKAELYGYGDIDLTASPAAGQFVMLLRAPSATVPWVADIETSGFTTATAALNGPLMKLGGSGFATTTGGEMDVRAEMAASADGIRAEGLLTDRRGGELVAATTLLRDEPRTTSVDLFATNFRAFSNGRAVSLPGVTRGAVGLPSAGGVLSGYGAVRGTAVAPLAVVRLSATGVDVARHPVGRVVVGAIGTANDFRIQRLAVEGPAARIEADGNGRLLSTRGRQTRVAGVLEGNAQLDFDALRLPGGLHGRAAGSFAGSVNGATWLASVDASSATASIRGVPVRAVRATAGGDGRRVVVYGAEAAAAGGRIAAQGTLPGNEAGSLAIAARGVDLATMRGAGMPLQGGVIVGVAKVGGTMAAPAMSGAAALTGSGYGGQSLDGDAQADYRHGSLAVDGGRVVSQGGVASIDGSVAHVDSGDPTLALDIAMPEGDLAALSSAFGAGAQLGGIASARVRASGSLSRPTVAGDVESDSGTMRGVAYGDLRAAFSAAPGSVDVSAASVRFGTSRVAVSGTIAQGTTSLRASSASVDLNDFNDFFNGADILEGHGSLDVALATSASKAGGSGFVHFADSAIAGVPLGTLDGRLRRSQGGVAIDLRQRGDFSRSALTVRLVPTPDGDPWAYADGTVDKVDLAALAPYVHMEDAGVAGIARATVHASGRARAYRGDVAFAVDKARVRSTAVRNASGEVSFDPSRVSVRRLRVAVDGASVEGRGSLDRAGRLDAHAVANVTDLGALARLARKPVSMNGAAFATVDAHGTLARPTVRGSVRASAGQVREVAYDAVSADATYGAGRLNAGADVSLADGHGDLRFSADVPVMARSLRIGPMDQHVKVYGSAKGVGIASLSPLFGNVASAQGLLDGHVAVLGTAGRPNVSGDLEVRDATLRSKYDNVALTGLDADVALSQSAIALRRLHANKGAGTIDARGSAHIVPATALRKQPSLQYTFGTTLRGAQVDVPDYLKGTVDASVGVTKSGAVPYVFGSLAFQHTEVPFAGILSLAGHNAGPSTGATIPGLPPVRPGHIVVYGGSVFGDDLDHVVRPTPRPDPHPGALAIVPPKFALDVHVIAGQDVGVTGLLNVTGKGEVDVMGDTTSPRMRGTVTAVRGRAGFLNTSFDLLDGALTFHPKEGLLPTVSADAVTRTEDADITVSVYGRVDQLHTEMESDPPMTTDAIVATLLRIPQINSALASSHGQQQAALGVSPSSLVSGAVAGQILGALNVGLERVFNIEEVDFGLDPLGRPTLELRKQVSPRAYTLYRTTFTVPPAQAFGIAYQVRRALQVEFTQSQSTPGLLSSYAYPSTSLSVKVTFH